MLGEIKRISEFIIVDFVLPIMMIVLTIWWIRFLWFFFKGVYHGAQS
jgi:hypothetical protein